MHFQHGTIVFSPSDLTRFMESPFASWMDRLYLEFPDRVTPDERSDELQLYADAGITHEATFVKDLETNGTDLCWIKGDFPEEKAAATRQAMSEAREIIFQAHLKLPPFAGYADFLARVSTDPVLYEVWDTKLAHPEKSNRVFRLPRKIKGSHLPKCNTPAMFREAMKKLLESLRLPCNFCNANTRIRMVAYRDYQTWEDLQRTDSELGVMECCAEFLMYC